MKISFQDKYFFDAVKHLRKLQSQLISLGYKTAGDIHVVCDGPCGGYTVSQEMVEP